MAQIMVTSATLRNKKQELQQLNKKLKAELGNMETTVGTLKQSWTGEAHDAFYNQFNKDKIQVNNFYNAIEKYCTSLDEMIRKYEQTEAKNKQIAKS